jgi:hypothetical protein
MDHYYEMKNMIATHSNGYQPVETGHNADDKELKQVLVVSFPVFHQQ